MLFLVSAFSNGTVETLHAGWMKFLTLSVDMGGVHTQLDIIRSIGRRLRAVMSDREALKHKAKKVWDFLSKWEVLGVRYHGEINDPDPDDICEELIKNLVDLLSSAEDELDGVFIIIDEADAPPVEANLGEFVKLFTERLTRLGCDRVLLGLAGLPNTLTKLKESHASSVRIFEVLHLAPLEPNERDEVVRKGLALANEKNGFETAITKDAIELLCELSEGYPHFIQQFAYSAFEQDRDNTIDVEDVIEGAYKENGAIMQLGSKYFNEMYYGKISSEEYRKVLATMAIHGDDWVQRKTLVAESGVKVTTLNNALNTLKAREVIVSDDSRQGFYKLPTRSFAAWINAIRSVEEKGDGNVPNLFEER